jgi:hypothetical protein
MSEIPSTPSSNGNRTIHEWMMHIDNKLTDIYNKLDNKADKSVTDKIDVKVDKTELDKLELDFHTRLIKIEDKTNNLAIKQAGISGGIAALIMLGKTLFLGS